MDTDVGVDIESYVDSVVDVGVVDSVVDAVDSVVDVGVELFIKSLSICCDKLAFEPEIDVFDIVLEFKLELLEFEPDTPVSLVMEPVLELDNVFEFKLPEFDVALAFEIVFKPELDVVFKLLILELSGLILDKLLPDELLPDELLSLLVVDSRGKLLILVLDLSFLIFLITLSKFLIFLSITSSL